MNNIYTLQNLLRPEFEPILRHIIDVNDKLGIPYFIAGATARELLLFHVFGRDPGRQTKDIDTAIFVSGWAEFDMVKNAMLCAGFEATKIAHRVVYEANGLPVDIIPFGDIADEHGDIQWPPEHTTTMSVMGFKEAYDAAVLIDIGQRYTLKVASLAGMALLKLVAWSERSGSKDASDFLIILREYTVIYSDRLWDEDIPSSALNYDIDRQAAFLLGSDVKSLLSDETKAFLCDLHRLRAEELVDSMIRVPTRISDNEKLPMLFDDFWLGVGVG